MPLLAVIVPVRSLVPVFGEMEYEIVPFPFPLVVLSVIHESDAVAVQEELAVTSALPAPPVAEKVTEGFDMLS